MKNLLPLFIALLLAGCNGKEPEYQGRTLTAWVDALQDPDAATRSTAGNVLGELAPSNPAALKALIKGVKQGNYAAADVLGRLGKDGAGAQTPDVVQALAETMRSKGNVSARLAAARALPRFGAASAPGVPALVDMLKDENSRVREEAAETLGKLPADLAKQASPALLEAAKNDVLAVQQKALETLRAIDPEALKKLGQQ